MVEVSNFLLSFLDYPDNESLSTVVYFPYCNHNCMNCHNKDIGLKEITLFSDEGLYKEIKKQCEKSLSNKIVFSGGDPLHSKSRQFVIDFCNKHGGEFEICIYTGYSIEGVKNMNLKGFTFLKCGKYVEFLSQDSIKNDEVFILASKNQEMYDKNYTLISNEGIIKF